RPLAPEGGRAAAVADDLGVPEELVPPAVVAVVMRVHHPCRRPVPDPGVGLDQAPRVRQVPERVDDQPAPAVDEAGVARAEAAIGLEAGVDVTREWAELHGRRLASLAAGRQRPQVFW